MLENPRCAYGRRKGKKKYFEVRVREVGKSAHFPVVTDVLLSDNRNSWISECVHRASLTYVSEQPETESSS